MRSFASRGDCEIVDEPFYAAYLAASGADHPMRNEVLASQSSCPIEVAEQCVVGEVNHPIHYQKHMTQHLWPEFNRSFILELTNVFLIREPERVVASFADRMGDGFDRQEIGFCQQAEVFDQVADHLGKAPLVVDAADIRTNSEAVLTELCHQLEIDYTESMLSWTAGLHPGYGVWAEHWYGSALQSTGFAPPDTSPYPPLKGKAAEISDWARQFYDRLAKHRIGI